MALAAVVLFALTSGATVFLIDPVFQEVLMTSREGGTVPGIALPAAGGELPEKARRLDLRRHLDAGYERLKGAFGVNGDDVVWFVPLLILAVFWIRSAADFVSGYAFQRVGLGVTTAIRNDIARRVVFQSSRFHEAHSTGELASRVVGDVTILQVAVSTRVLDLFQQSITLLVLVGMLLSTNFKLALASLAVAPFVVYPIVRFGRGMRRTSQDSQEQMAEIGKLLVEIARGYKVVRAFGKQEYEIARFARATRRHLKARLRAEVFANVSGPVVGALGALGAATFLVYAGHAIRSGALTGVAVIQFLANLVLMYDPIRRLNKVHLLVQDAAAAVRRVADLLAIPLDVAERPGAKRLTGFRSGIAFEGVEYAYGDKPALRGVSFEVRRGEIVALVGPSGAGKSTVVSLLLRFDDPAAGRIAIDGHDLRDLALDSLSGLMSIVTQETVLFDDTVRANIAYGRPDLPLRARARGGGGGLRRRVHLAHAGRIRNADRRGRVPPLRRRAPADRHRPRPARGSAGADPRRGHLADRQRVGGDDPEGARCLDAGPHDAGDRPPPLDRHGGEPDPGPRRRARGRERDARRAARRGRPLPPPARPPVPALKNGRRGLRAAR
ncbi:MAG: ABC transporter ATP-binding protein/permease [Thermoanaerobaculia bacterium]|nr:ABC transporter ATP-binding protein/permease [Thermoanaerobaculia bacterium]